MVPITTVIITKNESRNIEACIHSARFISDDIIVVDCGSDDQTTALAKAAGAKVITVEWKCYGHSRNTGAAAAKYDWIFSLDADERITPDLATALHQINLKGSTYVYKIRRENYFLDKKLNYGTPGFDKVAKLYNRKRAQWDLSPVHERLETNDKSKKIKQYIRHFGISGIEEYTTKTEHYALLCAQKYLQQGKKATIIKRFLAPAFSGIKSYVFQLGFLDGRKGWYIAATITHYTWLKYKYLHELTCRQSDAKSIIALASTTYKEVSNSLSLKR
ncbi:MAG: glycosyltransferase family 2 protein [Flavisolibacter sp.]|nr:glycosyltransferase family 2 protein [Flavisolibacter sp.]